MPMHIYEKHVYICPSVLFCIHICAYKEMFIRKLQITVNPCHILYMFAYLYVYMCVHVSAFVYVVVCVFVNV